MMKRCGLMPEQKQFVLGKLKEAYRAVFYGFTSRDNGLNGRGYCKDMDCMVRLLGHIHALHGEIEGYSDDMNEDVSWIHKKAAKLNKLYGIPYNEVLDKMDVMGNLPDWAKE